MRCGSGNSVEEEGDRRGGGDHCTNGSNIESKLRSGEVGIAGGQLPIMAYAVHTISLAAPPHGMAPPPCRAVRRHLHPGLAHPGADDLLSAACRLNDAPPGAG